MKTKTAVWSISTQLDDYLRSDPTDDNDPLAFWRSQSDSAPGLAQMAKDVLAVAIAGVGVERVFSAARRVCSYQRHRLSRDTMKKVMIVRDRESSAEDDIVGEESNVDQVEQPADVDNIRIFGDADYWMAEEQEISDDEDGDGKRG
jgi:hypothetical protein